jgi:hypothetical protein
MLDYVSRSKRRPKVRYACPGGGPRNERNCQARSGIPSRLHQRCWRRIEQARLTREKADAKLTVLVDQAVGMGIGWPEIAAQLGVTRQAARQHYQRRHRDGSSRPDRVA